MVAAPRDLEAADDAQLHAAHDLVRRGRMRAAVVELEALRVVVPSRPDVAALLLECHLAQGDLAAALRLEPLLTGGRGSEDAAALHARAELAAATGDPDAAVDLFHAAGAVADDDLRHPWRAGSALALLHLGRRAEAGELALAQHVAAAAGGPYDRALALRVLATADGRPDVRLREALDLLRDVDAERLRAQLQVDLAGHLVLGGSAAAALTLLRRAEAYAASEGLWPLQGRVRRLLDRLGEPPHRAEAETLAALTAAERRVALLVVDGLSNRQVAERLVVSVKAVEGHLSRIYRKLQIGSRAALVTAVGPR